MKTCSLQELKSRRLLVLICSSGVEIVARWRLVHEHLFILNWFTYWNIGCYPRESQWIEINGWMSFFL
ncbi:hypothetical protein MRB53_017895 [Persea americana]|uniref:Uncharacterized protein n=1 Tax=Persea americana TaxID=3435 RepID=A0ACC2M5X1_PERAE|nr:hypothetical protein MRB53_017895 [Persea americana]